MFPIDSNSHLNPRTLIKYVSRSCTNDNRDTSCKISSRESVGGKRGRGLAGYTCGGRSHGGSPPATRDQGRHPSRKSRIAVSSIPCVHSPRKISSPFSPRASEPSRRSRCSSIHLHSRHVLELVDDGKYTYTFASIIQYTYILSCGNRFLPV